MELNENNPQKILKVMTLNPEQELEPGYTDICTPLDLLTIKAN